MDFNEEELIKIKKALSGMFKKSARQTVAVTLMGLKNKIDGIGSMSESDQKTQLLELLNEATAMRQEALRQGATSYRHPMWASAAASESWLHVLMQHKSGAIDDATLSRTNSIVEGLIKNH